MKKRIVRIILIALSLLWIVFIFSNSLEDSVESGAKSSWALEIARKIFPSISEFFIRKFAHFTEFAILGFLSSASISSFIYPIAITESKKLLWIFLALPTTFLTACFDEFLQKFSEGRHPAFTDVLIDTSGGLFAILISVAALWGFIVLRTKGSKKAY